MLDLTAKVTPVQPRRLTFTASSVTSGDSHGDIMT